MLVPTTMTEPDSAPPPDSGSTRAGAHEPQPIREHYTAGIETMSTRIARLSRSVDRLATARGVVFLIGIGGLIWTLRSSTESPAIVAGLVVGTSALVFTALVFMTGGVRRSIADAQRVRQHYQLGLARMDLAWPELPSAGERYIDPEHPYAGDLDLFGERSLFVLLSACRTRLGEDRLAAWLSTSTDEPESTSRREAAEELATELALQERFAALPETEAEAEQESLRRWAAEPLAAPKPAVTWFAIGLAVLTIVAFGLLLSTGRGVALCAAAVIGHVALFKSQADRLRRMLHDVGAATRGLHSLIGVLKLIEGCESDSPRLTRIVDEIRSGNQSASEAITRLGRLLDWTEASTLNQFFAPLGIAACLPTHLCDAVARWHKTHAASVSRWFDAVSEFEALLSLARFRAEHPDFISPEVVTDEECFTATDLGHPLIEAEARVGNDIDISGPLRLVMVSGSNMSGKSTFLRSIGVNAVLALMGGCACAKSLRLSRWQVGSELRIHDSLQSGASLFYAVIRRLKQIADLTAGTLPVLFLLDEILQGTNSNDRRAGAQMVIRRLIERNARGVVTTHDLALTDIVNDLGDQAVNRHFRDELTGGTMTFDYQLRAGVVDRTNALALMELIGLTTPTDEQITKTPAE